MPKKHWKDFIFFIQKKNREEKGKVELKPNHNNPLVAIDSNGIRNGFPTIFFMVIVCIEVIFTSIRDLSHYL